MRLFFCFILFMLLLNNVLAQSELLWVNKYDIRSNELKVMIEDTLKRIEIFKLIDRGYTPVMTIKSNQCRCNDSLVKKEEILVSFKIELQKVDSGIIAKPGKIGVARVEEMEIILILYAFNGLLPVPGQSLIKTYSFEETIEMWRIQPFSEVEVCTILWDGKSYYYENTPY